MTTRYTMRATIAAPEAMLSDANQMAACMGLSLADLQTFGEPAWQDEQGNRYSVCSAAMTPRVLQAAGAGEAVRPEYDTQNQIDMAGAGRALAALAIGEQLATPDKIVAIIDVDPHAAIALMGLTRIESDDD